MNFFNENLSILKSIFLSIKKAFDSEATFKQLLLKKKYNGFTPQISLAIIKLFFFKSIINIENIPSNLSKHLSPHFL